MDYKSYLNSEHWQKVKKDSKKKNKRGCLVCGSPFYDLHHLSYKNLGHEEFTKDLAPLCREHHFAFHDWIKEKGLAVGDILIWLESVGKSTKGLRIFKKLKNNSTQKQFTLLKRRQRWLEEVKKKLIWENGFTILPKDFYKGIYLKHKEIDILLQTNKFTDYKNKLYKLNGLKVGKKTFDLFAEYIEKEELEAFENLIAVRQENKTGQRPDPKGTPPPIPQKKRKKWHTRVSNTFYGRNFNEVIVTNEDTDIEYHG